MIADPGVVPFFSCLPYFLSLSQAGNQIRLNIVEVLIHDVGGRVLVSFSII